MSNKHNETITCDKCGKESEFTVYEVISTDDDPDMKEKIREGMLFDWKCPDCGHEATMVYPLLYHQPEDRLMIYIEDPESNDDIEAPEGYTCRVTENVNQFLEKLAIFDDGLDDRVIEMMKLFIVASVQAQTPGIVIKEFLYDRDGKGNRFFTVLDGTGEWKSLPFGDDTYEEVRNQLDEKGYDDALKINAAWAVETVGRWNKEAM